MDIVQPQIKVDILRHDLIVGQYNLLNRIVFYTFTKDFIEEGKMELNEYYIGRWHIKPKKLES